MRPRERAVEGLKYLIKHRSSLNSWGFVYDKEGKANDYKCGNVCYDNLTYDNGPKKGLKYFITTFQQGYRADKEATDAFLKWLTTTSPWAGAFIKQEKNIYETGLICRVDVPANYLIGACTKARETHEYPHKVNLWWEMVKAGADPDLSALATYYYSYDKQSDCFYRSSNGRTSGHQADCPAKMTIQSLKNYLSCHIAAPGPIFKESQKYYGIFKLWIGGYAGDRGKYDPQEYADDRGNKFSFPLLEKDIETKGGAFGGVMKIKGIPSQDFAKAINDYRKEIMAA